MSPPLAEQRPLPAADGVGQTAPSAPHALRRPATPPAPWQAEAASLVELQAVLLAQPGLDAAAAALAQFLAPRLGAERVDLGLLIGGRIRLLDAAAGATDSRHEARRQALTAAMEEAVDQMRPIEFPVAPDSTPHIVLAHAELAALTGPAVCTLPMLHAGRAIGALTVAGGDKPLAGAARAWCERAVCLAGPLLMLAWRAEQPWWARLSQSRPGHRGKAIRTAGLVGLVALAALPAPYWIGAPARIEGAIERVVAAPADGFLHRVLVQPGDPVRAGQIVVELADRDLELEQARWQSTLSQHENSSGTALARGDRAEFAINRARAAEARAQLELVAAQRARGRLAAPLDGIVIEGDLRDSIGAPVEIGQTLLTIAPAGRFRLAIEVDERDIGNVSVGQRGQLALAALPQHTLEFTIERVTPVAHVHEGNNAYAVEAALLTAPAGLRPGMQGVAKIAAGSRALGWRVTHRLFDWLRLMLWSWSP